MKTAPRLGQWVTWRDRVGIYCGDGSGPSAVAGGARTVGVWDAGISAFVPRALAPAAVPAGHGIVDVVAQDTGVTETSLLLPHEDLAEVTSASQLPVARRATAPAGWAPGGSGADRRMSDWGFADPMTPRTQDERRALHDLVDAWTSARWSSDSPRMAELEAQIRTAGGWVRIRAG